MSKYKMMVVALLPVMALSLVACQFFRYDQDPDVSLQDRPEVEEESFDVEEKSFTVGDTPTLRVDIFAGDVTIRGGRAGAIRLVVTRRARSESDMRRISVTMSQEGGGVTVEWDKPSGLGNVSVDLEIDVPTATRLEVNLGAGEVLIDGVAGETDIDIGNGNIDYQGQPQGDFRFLINVGNITLRLPADVNVEVDLKTGIGEMKVDFPVPVTINRYMGGDVSAELTNGAKASGTIGTGAEGMIHARVGKGDINLFRQ